MTTNQHAQSAASDSTAPIKFWTMYDMDTGIGAYAVAPSADAAIAIVLEAYPTLYRPNIVVQDSYDLHVHRVNTAVTIDATDCIRAWIEDSCATNNTSQMQNIAEMVVETLGRDVPDAAVIS